MFYQLEFSPTKTHYSFILKKFKRSSYFKCCNWLCIICGNKIFAIASYQCNWLWTVFIKIKIPDPLPNPPRCPIICPIMGIFCFKILTYYGHQILTWECLCMIYPFFPFTLSLNIAMQWFCKWTSQKSNKSFLYKMQSLKNQLTSFTSW